MMMKNSVITLAALLLTCSCLPIQSIDSDINTENSGNQPGINYIYPMGAYGFEQNADDISGNGCPGVLMGNPEFISDTPTGNGYALRLNAFKEQYINIPYALLYGLEEYTVLFWIKDFTQGVVFSASGGNNLPLLIVTDEQKFELYNHDYTYVSPDDYTFSYDCTPIMSGEWHHIAVSSSKGTMSLYVDGVKTDTLKDMFTASTCTKICIGGNGNGFANSYISMKVDEFFFYAACLSDADISRFYKHEN